MSYEVVLGEADAKKLGKPVIKDESIELLVKAKTGWATRKRIAKVISVDKTEAFELFLNKNVRILRWKA